MYEDEYGARPTLLIAPDHCCRSQERNKPAQQDLEIPSRSVDSHQSSNFRYALLRERSRHPQGRVSAEARVSVVTT